MPIGTGFRAGFTSRRAFLLGRTRLSLAAALLLLLTTLGSPVLEPDLHSRLRQVDFQSYLLPHEDVRVTSLGEKCLQDVQLRPGEGSALSTLLPRSRGVSHGRVQEVHAGPGQGQPVDCIMRLLDVGHHGPAGGAPGGSQAAEDSAPVAALLSDFRGLASDPGPRMSCPQRCGHTEL